VSPSPTPVRSAPRGFFQVELDLGHAFMEIAETNMSMRNTEAARRAMAQARQGCETVERFLTSSRHAKHLSKDSTTRLMPRVSSCANDWQSSMARLGRHNRPPRYAAFAPFEPQNNQAEKILIVP